jgi:hypothetical protein
LPEPTEHTYLLAVEVVLLLVFGIIALAGHAFWLSRIYLRAYKCFY